MRLRASERRLFCLRESDLWLSHHLRNSSSCFNSASLKSLDPTTLQASYSASRPHPPQRNRGANGKLFCFTFVFETLILYLQMGKEVDQMVQPQHCECTGHWPRSPLRDLRGALVSYSSHHIELETQRPLDAVIWQHSRATRLTSAVGPLLTQHVQSA